MMKSLTIFTTLLLLSLASLAQVVGNGGTDSSGPIKDYPDKDEQILKMKSIFHYDLRSDISPEEKDKLSQCQGMRITLKGDEYDFRKSLGSDKEYTFTEFNNLLDKISIELIALSKTKLNLEIRQDHCTKCEDKKELYEQLKYIHRMHSDMNFLQTHCSNYFEPNNETKQLIEKIASLAKLSSEIKK